MRKFGVMVLVVTLLCGGAGLPVRHRTYYPSSTVPGWFDAAHREYALCKTLQALISEAVRKHYLLAGKMPGSLQDLVDSGALLFRPPNCDSGQTARGDLSRGDIRLTGGGSSTTFEAWVWLPSRFEKPAEFKPAKVEIEPKSFQPNGFLLGKGPPGPKPSDPVSNYRKVLIEDKPGYLTTLNAKMLAEGLQMLQFLDNKPVGSAWGMDLTIVSALDRLPKIEAGWKNPYTGKPIVIYDHSEPSAGDINYFYDANSIDNPGMVLTTWVEVNGELWEFFATPHVSGRGKELLFMNATPDTSATYWEVFE